MCLQQVPAESWSQLEDGDTLLPAWWRAEEEGSNDIVDVKTILLSVCQPR